MIRAALIWAAWPAVALAQVPFDAAPLNACLADGGRDACIGITADACMEQPAGQTTAGMTDCFSNEWAIWDARLNATYAEVMTRAGKGSEQATALRDMQRAWITYRDAACAYDGTTWEGGSGRVPSAAHCQMVLTARQALWLDRYN
ncbi:lysozyme inhibitor LprI family protein [Paracoccus sp. (in: a-proteobacteria)]|uniref:lysozyme inhibitor LprI family protein n=1 Tax=Paracoccus sp. TaxID=267 RepID=UPI0026DF3AA9|nr:lysozyme inhibitor LprI family protein [Paracoccus sp. (in: a-proteobacteria)]MDO5646443.1 lysozyme inhibitor LprI family protein [Paracoccus sp. (in: a-proteobacteria)]